MGLAPGTKLGAYEILGPLGAGGMGEVYRAKDTKLKRDVALKVLPEVFGSDPDRMARFQREAEVLALLNHTNIAQIYGVEDRALVMELVEGESPKGPMPFDEAWKIASQIVDGLDYAHEKGIVHRDLKPANIKITPDGIVKLLDFGLAKAFTGQTVASGNPENSPTLTLGATQVGVILGTAAYMSPEQAKGKAVDKRADIWSFGVVLFELLTGERLFAGEDVSETLAQVLTRNLDCERCPTQVQRLLKSCLERDRQKRLRDIGDARNLLDVVNPALAVVTAKQRVSPWKRLAIAFAAIAAIASAGIAAWFLKPSPALNITRVPITLGDSQRFSNIGRLELAVSPDGTQIAYVANQRIYLRSLSDLEARPIPGTDLGAGVTNPVFSPDGKSLAFHFNADNTLKKVAVTGGAAITICSSANPLGMTWDEEGIVFVERGKDIMLVSPNGGTPQTLIKLRSGETAEKPQFMPGGQAVLFTVLRTSGGTGTLADWDKAQIVVQTLKTGARKVLVEGGADARYLPTGHIVYALSGVLLAQAFNLRGLEKTGGPVPILEGVARAGNAGAAQFAFSSTGLLVYVPGPASTMSMGQISLATIGRKGAAEALTKISPGTYDYPRVSPDGKHIAYQADDSKQSSIWTYDLSGANAPNHLTLTGNNRYPVWSADSERIAFQSDREGDLGIWWQRADGSGTPERLTKPEKGTAHIPDAFSKDRNTLSFDVRKDNTDSLWTYSLRDKKETLFVEDPGARLYSSVFSPDGRWIAYERRAMGEIGIFVKPFPPTATTYQISKDGGRNPLWSPDGKQMFYNGNGQTIFAAVSITMEPRFAVGTPEIVAPGFLLHQDDVRPFDVLPNGNFMGLVLTGQVSGGTTTAPQIQVVLNWFEDVKQRAQVK